MNIETFREDLRQAIAKNGLSQCELARVSGVGQYNISRFLNPPERNGRIERDMKLSVAMKLWPFVYGCDFTPKAPATPRGGEDAA